MNIPKSMKDTYDVIAPIIFEFCVDNLNEEYAAMSLLLLEKLCRKRPSPLLQGNPNTWACGIVYTIGTVNFLYDRSQPLYMRAVDLANGFGLSQTTASKKSSDIKKLLKVTVYDPEWTLPSKLKDNPYAWMFETNTGLIFDIRNAPRELQEEFYNAGMIPFIPDDCKASADRDRNMGSKAGSIRENDTERKIAADEKALANRKSTTDSGGNGKIIPFNAGSSKKKQGPAPVEGQISFDDDPQED